MTPRPTLVPDEVPPVMPPELGLMPGPLSPGEEWLYSAVMFLLARGKRMEQRVRELEQRHGI
jgi:hypothetical protein